MRMGTFNGTETSGAGSRSKQKFHEMMFVSLTHKGSSPCWSGEQTIAGFNFILFIELTILAFLITPTIGSMSSLSWVWDIFSDISVQRWRAGLLTRTVAGIIHKSKIVLVSV